MKLGVSYFGQHDPVHIHDDLIHMKRDFDWVLFPITEEDMLFRADGFWRRLALAKDLGI